jgi:hypothetical protein
MNNKAALTGRKELHLFLNCCVRHQSPAIYTGIPALLLTAEAISEVILLQVV